MKIFKYIVYLIPILFLITLGIFVLSLTPYPYDFYNSFIKPTGTIWEKSLNSYGTFDIKSSFTTELTRSELKYSSEVKRIYDEEFNEYYEDEIVTRSEVEIGKIQIRNMSDATAEYQYPNLIGFIGDNRVDICAKDCKNFMGRYFNIKSKESVDITLYVLPTSDLSDDKSSEINIYYQAYASDSKGPVPINMLEHYQKYYEPVATIGLKQ